MKRKAPQNIDKYQDHYSENKLWKKMKLVGRKIGIKTAYRILLLVYILKSADVSKTDKTKIYGALGYFILPADFIPDLIPITGYSDDIAALAWALHAVWKNVTPEIKLLAQQKLKEWCGEFDSKDLNIFG